MRVLVTGNTGFKGTWLSIYLSMLGHEVHGYSLDYHQDGLNYRLDSKEWLSSQTIADIRDNEKLKKTLQSVKPELVFHLAAQPIVLDSFSDPVGTFDVNVNGTLNLLDVGKLTSSVKRILVVTSDKVYDQREFQGNPSKEIDRLGGGDPYSYSKACQDLLSQSFQALGDYPEILIARAGNVLGGFDKGKHRLLPDIVRSIQKKKLLEVRNPNATRPWQHVLDCVSGYIKYSLADAPPPVLNFGPKNSFVLTVSDLIWEIKSMGWDFQHMVAHRESKNEASHLILDSSLAKQSIEWEATSSTQDAIRHSLIELQEGMVESNVFTSVEKHIDSHL